MSRLRPKPSEDTLDPQRPISPSATSIASPRSQQTVVPMRFGPAVTVQNANGEAEGFRSPQPSKRSRKHSDHNPNTSNNNNNTPAPPTSPTGKGDEAQGQSGQFTSPTPRTIDGLLSNMTSPSNTNNFTRPIETPSPLGTFISMTPGGLDDVTALSGVSSYLPSPQTDINSLPGRPIPLPLRGSNFSTRTPPPVPKSTPLTTTGNPVPGLSLSGSGSGSTPGPIQTHTFVRTRQYSHTPSPPAASFSTPDGDGSRSPTEVFSEVGTIGAVPSLAEGSELSTPHTTTTALPPLPVAVDGLKDFILRETHHRFSSHSDFTMGTGTNVQSPVAYVNGQRKPGQPSDTSVVNEKTFSSESSYVRQRRNLLDILSRLHSTGVQKDIDLPQIVVIGSQSVGKSSLIESMSGITLPRDTGACTRCPLECRLEYSTRNWSCRIFLRVERDPVTGALLDKVMEHRFGPVITDPTEVENVLRRAQRALLRPTLDPKHFLNDQDLNISDPPPLSFTSNCVCMHITGPDVPDLFFYDLPGIIANIREGGNIKDIELVRELVKSYISRPSCLILLVVSCETDFENQGAGRLALEADPTGQRIIGVLTKPDRIENTTGDKWAAVLRNEENRLVNGWFCVKQPDPIELRQEKISWEEARTREEAFFANSEPWKSLDENFRPRLGSLNLIRFLSRLLSRFIALRLPELEKELDTALEDITRRLSDLPVPRYEDPCTELVDLVFEFGKTLSRDIRGAPSLRFDGSASRTLMQNIRVAQIKLRSSVVRTAPKFCPWAKQDTPPGSPSIQSLKIDVTSICGFSAIGVPMTWVAEPKFLVKDEQHPFDDRVGRVMYLDEIMEIVEQSVTRELPGDYPTYIIKEELIRVALRAWRKPMMEYFDIVHHLLSDHVKVIVDDCFGVHTYSGLHTRVLTIVRDELRTLRGRTVQRLCNLFNVEGLPFTLNHTYLKEYKDKFLQHYREIRRRSRGQDLIVRRLTGPGYSESDIDEIQSQTTQQEGPETANKDLTMLVETLQKLGLPCTPADLHRLLPDDECEPALDIMASVRAYFQVAFRRFIDLVALEVDVEFVRGFERSIRSALITGLDIRSPERCTMWLQDSPGIASRRKELFATKRRLEAARSELASFMLT